VHAHKSDNRDIIHIIMKINGVPHVMEFDSGCKKSMISEAFWKEQLGSPKLEKTEIIFKTYTDEEFSPLGELKTQLEYKGQKKFYSIPVSQGTSLFGRDLMKLFKIDWGDIASQCNIVGDVSHSQLTLESLVEEYKDVFSAPQGRIKNFKAKIIMKDDATPKFMKARPIPYALKDKVDAELEKMEQLGQIKKIQHSEWASPLVVVPKANGKVRITADFKNTINNQLCVNQYPLSNPEELFNTVSSGDKFTKLDGTDAYHQIELEECSKKYLVINTHRGLFQYQVLPQGVASSPAIFQEFMDILLQGIKMTGSFLDDGLCSGITDQQHLENLRKILARMRKANYRLSREKSEFMREKLSYLGHIISKTGIHTDPAKVEDIMNIPKLKDVSELRSFLGLINFYGKFIPSLADICHPLYRLLRDNVKWNWSAVCQQSFMKVKSELASHNVLTHFNPKIPLGISCDASARGLGIILFHRYADGSERPLQYASRTLTQAECNYSQIEKEGLAIIFAMKKFYKYLLGRKFILITDHKPLLAIFGPKHSLPPLVATRLHHWSLYMSQFQYTIEYRKSEEHGNADALSRLPAAKFPLESETVEVNQVVAVMNETLEMLPVTAKQIRTQSARDKVISQVIRYTLSGWPEKFDDELKPYKRRTEELSLQQGVLMWGTRTVIPKALRAKLLNELHSCHSGIVRMKSLARQYIWWPGIDEEIENICKSCTTCAVNQPNPTSAPLHPWQFPDQPWERLHADLAGPFLGRMWLIVVDAHSKWPEIFSLQQDTTSSSIIAKLREMFGRFGLPKQVVTDNGRQFVSKEFETFCKSNGVKHITSSVYHPRSNGEAERMVQTFKKAMKSGEGELDMRLQSFLSLYRVTPHATTGVSPSELLMGRKTRNRLDLLIPDVKENVAHAQQKQREHYDKKVKMRAFTAGQQVWVQTFKKDQPKWTFSFISQVIGPLTYIVEVDGQEMKRHIDQIVEATSPSSPLQQDDDPEQDPVPPEVETTEQEDAAAEGDFEQPPDQAQVDEQPPPVRRSARDRKAPEKLTYYHKK